MSTYYTENGHLVSDETVDSLKSSLRKLGQGVSRAAFSLNDHEVLKVDTTRGWAGSNRTECAVWDKLDEEDKPHFAAIIARADDYSWIVCEKVHTIASRASDTNRKILDDWCDEVMWRITDKYGISDMHDGNYGIRANGTPAIVDYAMTGDRDESDIASEECDCSQCRGKWCTWCNTNVFHDSGYHGEPCDNCNIRTNKTLQTFEHKGSVRLKVGHNPDNRVRVTQWDNWRICPTCANNRTTRDQLHTLHRKVQKELTGQLQIRLDIWNNLLYIPGI